MKIISSTVLTAAELRLKTSTRLDFKLFFEKLNGFPLNEAQELMFDEIERGTIGVTPRVRAAGVTTLFASYAIWRATTQPSSKVIYLTVHYRMMLCVERLMIDMLMHAPAGLLPEAMPSNGLISFYFGGSTSTIELIGNKQYAMGSKFQRTDVALIDNYELIERDVEYARSLDYVLCRTSRIIH